MKSLLTSVMQKTTFPHVRSWREFLHNLRFVPDSSPAFYSVADSGDLSITLTSHPKEN